MYYISNRTFTAHLLLLINMMSNLLCVLENEFSIPDGNERIVLKSHFSHSISEKVSKLSDLPLLIWWSTMLFQNKHHESTVVMNCGHYDCLRTSNRNYLNDPRTRGIFMYGTDINPNDLPLPRKPFHEWALFHEESPLNNYMLSHQPFIRLFNHTATFRRNSDFPLTLHYIPVNDYFTKREAVPLAEKNILRKKLNIAPVLYIQSHCDVPSDRDRYVRELMKYIAIDSYGKCLNNKKIQPEFEDPVLNLEKESFLGFVAQYKFHLAFENAFCEDYMTEKLMRPLHLGSVPVYKGSPSVLDWMPSNKSIIRIDDFESPRVLAEYIKRLDENDEEYESFLSFKTDGITNTVLKTALENREWRINVPGYPNMLTSFECFVCRRISKRIEEEKKDIELPPTMGNRSHMGCQQPYTLLIDPDEVPRGDPWREIDWIETYWEAFDHALAVDAMVRKNETDSNKFKKYLREMWEKRMNP